MPSPGLLPVVTTSTPGTRPLIASITFTLGTSWTSSVPTDATDPVTSRRTWVPYPTTTISWSATASWVNWKSAVVVCPAVTTTPVTSPSA